MEGRLTNSCGSSVETSADHLSLASRRYGQDAIIEVRGELDLANAPLLERALAEFVDDQSCRSIVIDLHDLDFVGSAGLSVLLNAQGNAQSRGGEIILARPTSAVMRTIQIAGLLSTFTIHAAGAPNNRATLSAGPETG
jgi:anti-sigma B factor antagonist